MYPGGLLLPLHIMLWHIVVLIPLALVICVVYMCFHMVMPCHHDITNTFDVSTVEVVASRLSTPTLGLTKFDACVFSDFIWALGGVGQCVRVLKHSLHMLSKAIRLYKSPRSRFCMEILTLCMGEPSVQLL